MFNTARANSQVSDAPLFSAQTTEYRRAKAIYDQAVTKARKSGPFCEMFTVTPAFAEILLASNPQNRAVSTKIVERYAKDMGAGNWSLNGEAIIVADTGELNDGQHRCHAIIHAGKPQRIFVMFGVERESRTTVDQGIKRTVGHILGMAGYTDYNHLAHAARIAWQYRAKGKISRNPETAPTSAEIEHFVAKNPLLQKAIPFGRLAHKSKLCGIGLYAGVHFLLNASDAKAAPQFSEIVTSGYGYQGKTDPTYVVRKRLTEWQGRLNETEIAALIIKAWNAWRAKETVKMLKFNDGEDFPVVR